MPYDFISADCHVDLIWLPPDLFTANATAALRGSSRIHVTNFPYLISSHGLLSLVV
jgi:hypothetical protein